MLLDGQLKGLLQSHKVSKDDWVHISKFAAPCTYLNVYVVEDTGVSS